MMAVIGCYDLHLYCDTGGDPNGGKCPHKGWQMPQFECTGTNETACMKQARRAGWTFKEGGTKAYCPKCSTPRPASGNGG